MAHATPTETAPIALDTRRELLVLARNSIRFTWMTVSTDLASLSPLPTREREKAFDELCARVDEHDRFERGELDWSDVIPDATGIQRDEQALEALKTFVELALDQLTDDAR